MNSRNKVVVVGSCMMDLISLTERLPKPGETIQGTNYMTGFGGKGANQAVVASRLGSQTAMIAMVGKDANGEAYIQNFKDNNVNADYVKMVDGTHTGIATILVANNGENAIVLVSGANLKFQPSFLLSVDQKIFETAKVVITQLEVKQDVTLAALKLAKEHGATTILNAAPGRSDIDPQLFTFSDIFCVNETEAELVTGIEVTNVETAKLAVQNLLSKECKIPIITLGANGAVFASADVQFTHVAAPKVKAVDTTGAGDAFVGALAYYLAKMPNLSLEEMTERSCRIASSSVLAHGTQTSFPWLKDLPVDLFQ